MVRSKNEKKAASSSSKYDNPVQAYKDAKAKEERAASSSSHTNESPLEAYKRTKKSRPAPTPLYTLSEMVHHIDKNKSNFNVLYNLRLIWKSYKVQGSGIPLLKLHCTTIGTMKVHPEVEDFAYLKHQWEDGDRVGVNQVMFIVNLWETELTNKDLPKTEIGLPYFNQLQQNHFKVATRSMEEFMPSVSSMTRKLKTFYSYSSECENIIFKKYLLYFYFNT